MFLLSSGINLTNNETCVVPIVENTPFEEDLKVCSNIALLRVMYGMLILYLV